MSKMSNSIDERIRIRAANGSIGKQLHTPATSRKQVAQTREQKHSIGNAVGNMEKCADGPAHAMHHSDAGIVDANAGFKSCHSHFATGISVD